MTPRVPPFISGTGANGIRRKGEASAFTFSACLLPLFGFDKRCAGPRSSSSLTTAFVGAAGITQAGVGNEGLALVQVEALFPWFCF